MKYKYATLFLMVIITSCSNLSSSKILQKVCVPVQSERSSIQLENGLILSGKETYILNGEVKKYFSSLKTSEYYVDISNVIVTPNGEKIAYIATKYLISNNELSYVDQSLRILMDNENEREITDWQPENEEPIEWFDNENLLFSLTDHSDGTIMLFNPLTQEKRKVSTTFSNIYNLDRIPWYKGPNPLPIYNSSMSLAFYLRNSEQGMEFALTNQKTGELLWSKVVHNPTNRPLWSPVEDKILIAIPKSSSSDFEFYTIDKNGQEIKLSNFNLIYSTTYINGFNWSPDGQSIGFWLDGRKEENEYFPRFAIFNLKNKQTTDYCIGPGGGNIIWSPSGNQVALTVGDRKNPDLLSTVVIDIQKNIAVEVSDQEYPVGWRTVK